MSASKDRSLWGWSLRRDGQSTELSQGAVQKKARRQGLLAAGIRDSLEDLKCPPITGITCSLNRDGGIGAIPGKHAVWQGAKGSQVSAEISGMTGWESVVTAHENDSKARTWFWGRKRAGRWAFQTGDGSNVTSVAMSPCGTFAIIGSEKGGIDMFNMQSGIHRQRYPARLTAKQAKQLRLDVEKHGLIDYDNSSKKFYRGQGKHATAVVGLAIDNLNKTIVSAGTDGKVKFWDFATGILAHEIEWSSSTRITGMRFHRGSDLAAISCTDGCVRVVDISTHKLIRELWPSRFPIDGLSGLAPTDFTFSSDGTWIAACIGQIVLLWDLPTGHLVDAFKLKAKCTTLAFSPTGEFLVTAATDSVGVDVWSNRALFMHVPTRLIGVKELADIVAADSQAPTAGGEGAEMLVADEEDSDDVDIDVSDVNGESNIDQLTSNLLSLSLVPRSRWQNLLHLDLIRQRNKPVEPPKKPEKAPFFLPSLEDRGNKSNTASTNITHAAELQTESSRIGRIAQHGRESEFTSLLHASAQSNDFTSLVQHLQTLNPAAADIAIRSMGSDDEETVTFVKCLTWLMRERRDFELGQAWMAVFLRIHGDIVFTDDRLRQAVDEWSAALHEEKKRVQRLSTYCNGLVGYLRAARV
jgi:U3 small nucleolar RNA-associated protein 21